MNFAVPVPLLQLESPAAPPEPTYSRLGEPEFRGLEPRQIDDLKQWFHRPPSRLRMLASGEFAYPSIRARLVSLAAALDGSTNRPEARNAEKTLADRIDDIMAQL